MTSIPRGLPCIWPGCTEPHYRNGFYCYTHRGGPKAYNRRLTTASLEAAQAVLHDAPAPVVIRREVVTEINLKTWQEHTRTVTVIAGGIA